MCSHHISDCTRLGTTKCHAKGTGGQQGAPSVAGRHALCRDMRAGVKIIQRHVNTSRDRAFIHVENFLEVLANNQFR